MSREKMVSSKWIRSIPLLNAKELLYNYYGSTMPCYGSAINFRWKSAPPELVIFISHRWLTPKNPDPKGITLKAIKHLLESINTVAKGFDATCNSPVPNLLSPYMLQASLLFDRLIDKHESWEQLDWQNILQYIAIFYDYSCLPQGDNAEQRELRMKGLANFPEFITDSRVSLVAIRSINDDYENRIWCIADSTLAVTYDKSLPWAELFPIRIDTQPSSYDVQYSPLKKCIKKWTNSTFGKTYISTKQFEEWCEILNQCRIWFSEQPEEATQAIHHTGIAANVSFKMFLETMLRIKEKGNSIVDIEPIIIAAAIASGLKCSNNADYVPAGLITLSGLRWEQLNRGEDLEEIDIWLEAFTKYCNNQPLKVEVRLRPSRGKEKERLPRIRFVEIQT